MKYRLNTPPWRFILIICIFSTFFTYDITIESSLFTPLKQYGIPLVGYNTDSQRYFDMHHSPNDTFDQINFRELQLGSGCMASLIYLIDKYGVE